MLLRCCTAADKLLELLLCEDVAVRDAAALAAHVVMCFCVAELRTSVRANLIAASQNGPQGSLAHLLHSDKCYLLIVSFGLSCEFSHSKAVTAKLHRLSSA